MDASSYVFIARCTVFQVGVSNVVSAVLIFLTLFVELVVC